MLMAMPLKTVGVILFRVTKEQDTSDSEIWMPLATVPLPQGQPLLLTLNMKRLFFVACCIFDNDVWSKTLP